MTDDEFRAELVEIDALGNPPAGFHHAWYSDSIENEIKHRWPSLGLLDLWVDIAMERDEAAHLAEDQ